MAAQHYRLSTVGTLMGIGVADAVQVTVSAVAKQNGPHAPYCIPNELICSELGRFLRLPIPPCGIVRGSVGAPYFASMNFNLTGTSLPPINAAPCWAEFPRLCAGVLLFDILIANCDRNRRNLAADFVAAPPTMSVFDHSHALFGEYAGAGQARLQELRDRLGCSGGTLTESNRHCMLDVVSGDNDFADWVERIKTIPDFLIEELCRDAAEFGLTPMEVTEGIGFLKHRRDNLPTIIETHRAEFRAIRSWSLFA